MASWTNEIWQHTETMIEHGTEACYVPKSTLFIRCDKNYAVPQSRNDDLRNPGKPYVRIKHNLRSTDVVKKRTGLGMFLYPRKRTLASLEAHRQGRAVKEAIKEATREDYKDVQRLPITSSRPYSEAGRSVAFIFELKSLDDTWGYVLPIDLQNWLASLFCYAVLYRSTRNVMN